MLLFIATFFGGLTFQCSAMDWDAGVYVRNDSNWPLEINYIKNGEPLVIQLGTGGKIAYLGQASQVKDAKYHSSADILFSHPITFLNKTRAGDDFMFVITTWYGKWSESEEHPEPGTISKDITGTPDSTAKKESPLPEKGSPSVSETKESSPSAKSSSSQPRTAEESMVWVRNDSGYKVKITYITANGDKRERRLGIAQTMVLGKANTLKNVTYHAYGDVWEKTSPATWPLDIQGNIKANSDLLFKITTFLQVFSVSIEYLASGEIPTGKVGLQEADMQKKSDEFDAWDLFENDEAKTAILSGDKDKAYRFIFGLTPNYTQQELKTAYTTLSLTWHPDKGKLEQARDGRAMQILNDAYSHLNNKFS